MLTANGQGPAPTISDPLLSGTVQFERATTPEPNQFITGAPTLIQNTNSYNFQYQQGYRTGTTLAVGFQNSRVTTNSFRSGYSPELGLQLQGADHTTPAEWLWHRSEYPVHRAGDQQPADH